MKSKPLLIIVNGPPGVGKTTLARRLAHDLRLPVVHRDHILETLFDGLECQTTGRPQLLGSASVKAMHYFAGTVLAAGQSLIVEGCFWITELATSEFLQVKQMYDYEPFQISCVADGTVVLKRFLARAGSPERHICHRDHEFAERNQALIVQGCLPALNLGGQVYELEMTDVNTYDYEQLLCTIRAIDM